MNTYPLSAYHFKVDWDGSATAGFTEISGLSIENQVIEYRNGSAPNSHVVKMPGIRKFTNVILKRGITKGDNDFFNWMNTIQHNTVERRDIVISLLNEKHEPLRVWRLKNAWPCKIESSNLKADGNEVVIETIELAHEGLVIENI
jgi:phage tail-like protein